MNKIEQQLSSLTDAFTELNPVVKCWTESEKVQAVAIFKKYYKNVEVSSGLRPGDTEDSFIIACTNPIGAKKLVEADNFGNESEDDTDLNLADLDSDDDTDIEDSEQLTVLKKRASDLAKKWKDTYNQISELAKKLDLVASYTDDLEIELTKADGKSIDNNTIENEANEVDDEFGPSQYDFRAESLGADVKVNSAETSSNITPIELQDDFNDIDDEI